MYFASDCYNHLVHNLLKLQEHETRLSQKFFRYNPLMIVMYFRILQHPFGGQITDSTILFSF